MSDFKGGGIKTTDYDSYNTKYITHKRQSSLMMFMYLVNYMQI